MPSFNQFMHPRNPYKERPDFADLAAQYPPLQPFLIPCAHRDDRVTIDFDNPDALRALTQGFFKCHWDLHVELPRDRLIPAIPQRLNYILWLEDLINNLIDINHSGNKGEGIRGIDIGTGASCVFPLLICRRNPSWRMLALESDAMSAQVAQSNITVNGLEERISLVNTGDCLSHLRHEKLQKQELEASSRDSINIPHFHFTVCNPPFFTSKSVESSIGGENEIQMEEQDHCDGVSDCNDDSRSSLSDAIVTREVSSTSDSGATRTHKSQRCKSTGNTSCDNDSITHGGEVEFVKRLIVQSTEIADSIDLFTVMLGSKDSLMVLKRELTRLKHENDSVTFNWTLLCQGRVVRWGLVWSFTKNLSSPSIERICCHKLRNKQNELILHLPRDTISPALDPVSAWTDLLVDLLVHSLNIRTFYITKLTAYTSVIIIKSNVNTWSHQRRKRRQLQRERDRLKQVSSQTNQPNAHQSRPQHVEDTQQDEMVIETTQGTSGIVGSEGQSSESIDNPLAHHSSVESVECGPVRQLMSLSSEDNKCPSKQSSCCKRKVDQMNSLDSHVDRAMSSDASALQSDNDGETKRTQQDDDDDESMSFQPEPRVRMKVQMDVTVCNVHHDHSDHSASSCKLPFDGKCKKANQPLGLSSHRSGSSSSPNTCANDQSSKKSRDTDSRKSMDNVCAKGQFSGKWVKLHKHHAFSVENEKVDDILYLLNCTVRIVKAIDSSVKLIIVNNENSLDHESAYQLFQFLKNRLLTSTSAARK